MSARGNTSGDLVDELLVLEERLLDPAARSSPQTLDLLLASEFTEFGSFGRVFSKEEIVRLLSSEFGSLTSITCFTLRFATDESALVTYESARRDEVGAQHIALRSSFWIRREGRWQMLFHQGTRR